MRYVAAILLFGLSLLLGLIVAMQLYVFIASSGLDFTPNFVMLGAFVLLAIVSFIGGIAILGQRNDKS
jgi:hypothetical protein